MRKHSTDRHSVFSRSPRRLRWILQRVWLVVLSKSTTGETGQLRSIEADSHPQRATSSPSKTETGSSVSLASYCSCQCQYLASQSQNDQLMTYYLLRFFYIFRFYHPHGCFTQSSLSWYYYFTNTLHALTLSLIDRVNVVWMSCSWLIFHVQLLDTKGNATPNASRATKHWT